MVLKWVLVFSYSFQTTWTTQFRTILILIKLASTRRFHVPGISLWKVLLQWTKTFPVQWTNFQSLNKHFPMQPPGARNLLVDSMIFIKSVMFSALEKGNQLFFMYWCIDQLLFYVHGPLSQSGRDLFCLDFSIQLDCTDRAHGVF